MKRWLRGELVAREAPWTWSGMSQTEDIQDGNAFCFYV